ncbi:MAG: DUF721 domain-containing protein [Thermodesulfobacteriota bacterium]
MPKSADDLPRVLQRVLRQAEASYPDRSHRIWEVWDTAVGPDVAARSRPLSLRSGRLTVAVESPAWMQQLSFLRETMRDAVNRALGEDLVREVRLRIAEAEPPAPPPRDPARPPPWLAREVPAEVAAAVDREVASIRDPELREAVRQTRLRAEQMRRFREDPGDAPPRASSARPKRGGRAGS